MAHTADIFLVDGSGRLRAGFPFGTPVEPIAASLTRLLRDAPPPSAPVGTDWPSAPPAAVASVAPAPAGDLRATVVSSSVWAGGASPVILTLADAMGMAVDGSIAVSVQLVGADGAPSGPPVNAVAVRPAGETQVSYVATIDIPAPGPWRPRRQGRRRSGRERERRRPRPGRLRETRRPGPDVDTPTLEDVGGNLLAISTQPQSDARFYQASSRTRGPPAGPT